MIDLGEVFFVADLTFGTGNFNFNLGGVVYQRLKRFTGRTPRMRQLREWRTQLGLGPPSLYYFTRRAIEKFEIGRDIV